MCEKIMNFKSLEEEMEFWDTHDATDFIGEEVTVEDIIKEHQSQQTSVIIQLDVKLLNQIKTLADKMSINYSLLMRDLLFEGLKAYLQ